MAIIQIIEDEEFDVYTELRKSTFNVCDNYRHKSGSCMIFFTSRQLVVRLTYYQQVSLRSALILDL